MTIPAARRAIASCVILECMMEEDVVLIYMVVKYAGELETKLRPNS